MPYKDPEARRAYNREYQRKWRQRNSDKHLAYVNAVKAKLRQEIDEYKLERGCADCGYSEHAVALDFDHVRGTKIDNISTMLQRGLSRGKIHAEMKKCEVVCANCHRVRTQKRNNSGVEESGCPR